MKIRPAIWPQSIPWSVRLQGFHARRVRTEVSRVAKGRGLDLALQPIFDIHSGRPIGYEALSRPRAFDQSPAELLEEATRQGRRWAVERSMRRRALAHLARLDRRALLFVNCSPGVLADERFVDDLLESLSSATNAKPRDLVLEITEEPDRTDGPGLDRAIAAVRKLGVQVAVDDVGAGSSGLRRIARFAPDWIKVDRGLVEELDRDAGAAGHVIAGLVSVADRCGARLIAEGVERPCQVERLRSLGVRFLQGFLLGRPVAAPAAPPPRLAA